MSAIRQGINSLKSAANVSPPVERPAAPSVDLTSPTKTGVQSVDQMKAVLGKCSSGNGPVK